MIGYSQKEIFPDQHIDLWRRARCLVASLSVLKQHVQDEIRCHELTRAVAKVLEIPDNWVRDGHYDMVEHSWIILLENHYAFSRRVSILDVYAMGRLPQVQLVYASGVLTEYKRYRERGTREDIQDCVVDYLVATMKKHQFPPLDKASGVDVVKKTAPGEDAHDGP